MGYANAHPRLKALDFQPSALLPPEAAAVYLNKHGISHINFHISPQVAPIRTKTTVLKPPHLLNNQSVFIC